MWDAQFQPFIYLYNRKDRIKMGHKNRKTLIKQVQDKFDTMLAIGESKHLAKKEGTYTKYIYSWNTYRTYLKHACYFVKFCKDKYKCKTVEECRPYGDEWLQSRSELSSYTQKLDVAALAKLYQCSSADFGATPSRKRKDITRSRGAKARDRHFCERSHTELVDFCQSTGLRRRELSLITGDKLIKIDDQYNILIDRGAKGGRKRLVPIIGNVENVINLMENAENRKVFDKVPQGADIHGYRREYATALYELHARKIEDIPYDQYNNKTGRYTQSDVYCCRGDLKGRKYDKQAMKIVTEALGHSRISVIAGHYLC